VILLVDKIIKNMEKKVSFLEKEKKYLRSKLQELKSENDTILGKNFSMLIHIDDLNTEIIRLKPDNELVEENDRLKKMYEKLERKCIVLNEEIQLRNNTDMKEKNNNVKIMFPFHEEIW
jgi:hypothetical protein